MEGQPRTAFAKAALRVLQMPSIWDVEPWTGALSLNPQAAWSMLDRLHPDADVDAASQFFVAFEAGAVSGWAKVRKRKV